MQGATSWPCMGFNIAGGCRTRWGVPMNLLIISEVTGGPYSDADYVWGDGISRWERAVVESYLV